MEDTDLYDWARRRARQLRIFYLHAAVYVVVMGFLFLINAVTRDQPGSFVFGGQVYHQGGGDWWVIWPALGWGVLLALHSILILVGGTGKIDAWEERKAEQLVRREREKSGV